LPSDAASPPLGAAAAMAVAVAAQPSWTTPLPGPGGALAISPVRLWHGPRADAIADGNWPRTARALPWMLAAFIAMLWLAPFDSIELGVTLPIDAKLDRLVLPIVFLAWALALVSRGPGAPRVRLTAIHAAVGAFVVVAFLSVILDAALLSQSLELDTTLKKLPLLLAYLSLFVMIASVVRREEVGPFLVYTLVLAVICSLGMIVEFRTLKNVFFEWSDTLLPGIFNLDVTESGYDATGRRLTHGPAAHGLVAVAMLSMALPIAVLGLMEAKRARGRILYGLAACLLIVAVLATQRKAGVVAPIAGVLTLAYFRRRDFLKILPIAAVLLAVAVIVSPGTVTPVLNQYKPGQFEAASVTGRAADYDAIRPDVWAHVALGRGYGSYQPLGHRILDSEILVSSLERGEGGIR